MKHPHTALLYAIVILGHVVGHAAERAPDTTYNSAPFRDSMAEMLARDAAARQSRLGQRRLAVVGVDHPIQSTVPECGEADVPAGKPGDPPIAWGPPPPTPANVFTVTQAFAGITRADKVSDFGTFTYVPDTMGAAGPRHFVEILNTSVAVFDKSTGSRLSHVSLESFFALQLGGTNFPRGRAFDPKLLYDQHAGRWFASALEDGGPVPNFNHVILAVSASDDPMGEWFKYLVPLGEPYPVESDVFSDFDQLGLDDNGVYVVVQLYPRSNYPSEGVTNKIAAIPKAHLLSNAAAPVHIFGNITNMYGTLTPAHNLDRVSTSDRAWFIGCPILQDSPLSHGQCWQNTALLWALRWENGTPLLGGVQQIALPIFQSARQPYQKGTSVRQQIGGPWFYFARIRHGMLWAVRHLGVWQDGLGRSDNYCVSTATRNACEYIEFDLSSGVPATVQNYRLYDPLGYVTQADTMFYQFPSLAVNGQGHTLMAFNGSSQNQFISAFYCGRLTSDPLNTMRQVILLKAGETNYTLLKTNATTVRWGDYSHTVIDPDDDMTFWTIQEYPSAQGSNNWATWIAKIVGPPPSLDVVSASGERRQTNIVLNLTGYGFFDPGTGFARRLKIDLVGGNPNGITNVSVQWLNASNVNVRFGIAAEAEPGARHVVLTNPDGQTDTLTNGFTVLPGPFPAPPILSLSSAVDSTNLLLRWVAEPNFSYRVWASTNLLQWVDLNTVTGAGQVLYWLPVDQDYPPHFFRVSSP